MANTLSAIKRIKTNERNRLNNSIYKGKIKNIIKNYLIDLNNFQLAHDSSKNKEDLKKTLNLAYSLIDKAVKKKIFHKNKAARKKSQITLDFNIL